MYFRQNGKKISMSKDFHDVDGSTHGKGVIALRPDRWDDNGITSHPNEPAPNYAANDVVENIDGTFTETPRSVPVPDVVEMASARLALLQSGYYADVKNIFNGMVGLAGEAARIEWETRPVVRRNSALTAALTAQLNLTEAQTDDLFILAATL